MLALKCGRSKELCWTYGGSAHGETFGLVAGRGRRGGIVLDIFMSLSVRLILAGRHPTFQIGNIIAADAINRKTLWRELCWLSKSRFLSLSWGILSSLRFEINFELCGHVFARLRAVPGGWRICCGHSRCWCYPKLNRG